MSRMQILERPGEHVSTHQNGRHMTQNHQQYPFDDHPYSSTDDGILLHPSPPDRPAYRSPASRHSTLFGPYPPAIRYLTAELACLACKHNDQDCHIQDGEIRCEVCRLAGRDDCRFERIIKCTVQFRPNELPPAYLLTPKSSPLLGLRELNDLLGRTRDSRLQDRYHVSESRNADTRHRLSGARQEHDSQSHYGRVSPGLSDYSRRLEPEPLPATNDWSTNRRMLKEGHAISSTIRDSSKPPPSSPDVGFGYLQHQGQSRNDGIPSNHGEMHGIASVDRGSMDKLCTANYRPLQERRGPGPNHPIEPEPRTVISETARPNQVQMVSSSSDPVVCPLCSQSFKRKGDLTRHWQSVHASASIDCEVADCPRKGPDGFHRQDHWREHMRQVHDLIRDVPSRKRGRSGGHEIGRKLDVGNYMEMRRMGACEACRRSKRKCIPEHVRGQDKSDKNSPGTTSEEANALAEQAQKRERRKEMTPITSQPQTPTRVSSAGEDAEIDLVMNETGTQTQQESEAVRGAAGRMSASPQKSNKENVASVTAETNVDSSGGLVPKDRVKEKI